MEVYLIVIGLALVAAIVQTSTGIGFAIIVMSVLPLFVPFLEASVTETLLVIPLVIFIVIRDFKFIRWKLLIVPMIASIPMNFLGVQLLMYIDDAILRRIVGGILVIICLFNLLKKGEVKVKPTVAAGLIAGGTSGLLAGMCNIGGPPMAIYTLSASETKEEYNATVQMYFVLTIVFVLVTHLIYGNVTENVLKYAGVGYIGVIVGTIIGRVIFKKMSEQAIQKAVYIVMAVMGVFLLIKG